MFAVKTQIKKIALITIANDVIKQFCLSICLLLIFLNGRPLGLFVKHSFVNAKRQTGQM